MHHIIVNETVSNRNCFGEKITLLYAMRQNCSGGASISLRGGQLGRSIIATVMGELFEICTSKSSLIFNTVSH